MTVRAVIKGCGHYLPKRIVENYEFEQTLDTSDEWISSRSGIRRRHFASQDETTSNMATFAAKKALEDAKLLADDIDAIILATSTSDLTFPSAATMVQAKLGMTKGFAYDIQAVCAGFVFALANANALIISEQAKRVLVIGSETFSKLMDWQDRSTCVLFGDGAGAVILSAESGSGDKSDRGILASDLHSDGRLKDILYVDGGVSTQSSGYLRMHGKEVYRHAIEKLATTAENSMRTAGVTIDEVDWIVPHQANIRIIHGTAKKMGIPKERILTTVQDHGNTSAASIPLALSVSKTNGFLKKNDLIVTEAIGGGLAWGSLIIRW
ncbi:ketoacyl-ACP synthase III [Paracoccaceae bacterium]|nr:ketoacyl-ACP synthase III [Paracoccaceae bacterium]MDB3860844.1 ketoacyl-ACP synthase III [Paracoccaceae bacterium]